MIEKDVWQLQQLQEIVLALQNLPLNKPTIIKGKITH
jgi:hypothetical protein